MATTESEAKMNMQYRVHVRIAMTVGLLVALGLLFGCTKSVTPASTADAAAQGSTETATVRLVAPSEGAEVPAGTVTVSVETTGLKFTMPSNTNVPGEGHVHFTLDDRPFVMSTEPSMQLEDVDAGTHILKAELVQNNTEPFDPPIEEVIEFTAK